MQCFTMSWNVLELRAGLFSFHSVMGIHFILIHSVSTCQHAKVSGKFWGVEGKCNVRMAELVQVKK